MLLSELEHIFRAYDIRGIFGKDLTPDVMVRIGYAYGTFLDKDSKVFVARDNRTSSEILQHAFISGLASTGVEIYYSTLLPIPLFNFEVFVGDYDSGAYITASHNPPEFNGIRFRHSDGTGYTIENQKIKEIFYSGKFRLVDWDKIGNIYKIENQNIIRKYYEYISKKISIEKEFNIAIDCGNGAQSVVAPYILREFGLNIISLNAQPDGRFPGRDPEPTDESLYQLKEIVRSLNLDFGAGFDGDGDRVIIVDDKGRVVPNEKVAIIIAKDMLKDKKELNVVANVSCSMILEQELGKLGVKIYRVRVGDVFITEAMKKYKARLGVELSSHFFLADFYYFDDPLLVVLRLAEILSKNDLKLSEIVDQIPSYPNITKNFRYDDRIKFKIVENIKEKLLKKGYTIDTTDGVKVIFEDGWFILRPSNTSPLIRLTVEAIDRKRLSELETFAENLLKEAEKELNFS